MMTTATTSTTNTTNLDNMHLVAMTTETAHPNGCPKGTTNASKAQLEKRVAIAKKEATEQF